MFVPKRFLIAFSACAILIESYCDPTQTQNATVDPICVGNIRMVEAPWYSTLTSPYYVPLATNATYARFAKVFLGRGFSEASNQAEFFQLKTSLNIQISSFDLMHTTTVNVNGLPLTFTQLCTHAPSTILYENCYAVPSSSFLQVNLYPMKTSENYIVWQNETAQAVLILSCVNSKFGNAMVLSQTSTLPSEVLASARTAAATFGFNNLDLSTYENP